MIDKTRNVFLLAALLAAGLLTPGCLRLNVMPQATAGMTVPMSEPRPVANLNVPHEKDPTSIYRIGARDVLRIDVRKDPAISQPTGYTVTEEGNVLLPYIGPVNVADLTAADAEKKLNTLLAQYIRDPEAKVGIQDYRSKFVYVVGQVARPGRVIMRADMLTLQEAVFQAGLPTPDAALQRTKVITPSYENPVVRQIDLTDIIYKGRMAENILLKPGDYVYVPAKQSSNLTAAIADLIRPIDEVVSVGYRASYSGGNGWFGFGGNNNNNNNSNGNNNNNNNNNNTNTTTK